MDEKLLRSRFAAVIVAFLYGLLLTVTDGILSNRADGMFVSWWPSVQQLMLSNLFTCICAALFIILYLFLVLYCRERQRILQQMLEIQQEIVELDNSLLRGLATLPSSSDTKQAMQRILCKLLRDAAKVFEGRIQRTALLVPNATKDDLQHWVDYQMPQGSIESMKFCVDHEPSLLDVEKKLAEEAFITGEVVVADLIQVNGNWVYKGNANTKKLTKEHPSYISAVAVPITSCNYDTLRVDFKTCLGVLCFESLDKQVFDSKAGKLILRALAVRVTIALLVYEQYRKTQTP